MDNKCVGILWDRHSGIMGGHYRGNHRSRKAFQEILWWPTIFKDAKQYDMSCDGCHRIKWWSFRRDYMPLHPMVVLYSLEKWVVELLGPLTSQLDT
jgi:hypothetical protein